MAPPCLPRLLAALICTLAATCALPAAAIAGDSVTVGDTSPDWAVPANEVGDEASSERLVFSLWLGWRNAPAWPNCSQTSRTPAVPAIAPG